MLPASIRLLTVFTSMNATLLVGYVRWLTKWQSAACRRTDRAAEVSGVLP